MTIPARLHLASAQYDIGRFANWSEYEAKIRRWVAEAAAGGAELLLFPEYHSMELASLLPEAEQRSLTGQLSALQAWLQPFLALHGDLARQHRVHILAGTFPVRLQDGGYRNRAHLFTPEGAIGHQDKVQMTRFENERWGIQAGRELKVFHTACGPIGVATCYDSEFPVLVRRLVEAGAELLLVPSCTDTLAGYHRVRIGCQGRALENQCYVVQASTVGDAPWSEAVDVNVGAAAVYTPVDYGFPDNGVLAEGSLNRPGWVHAQLEPARLDQVRRQGQVFNHRDWPAQHRLDHTGVAQVSLGG